MCYVSYCDKRLIFYTLIKRYQHHRNGCVVVVRQLFSPTVRLSDSSIVQQFDSPVTTRQFPLHGKLGNLTAASRAE